MGVKSAGFRFLSCGQIQERRFDAGVYCAISGQIGSGCPESPSRLGIIFWVIVLLAAGIVARSLTSYAWVVVYTVYSV